MFLLFVDLMASCEKVIHSFIPGTPGGGLTYNFNSSEPQNPQKTHKFHIHGSAQLRPPGPTRPRKWRARLWRAVFINQFVPFV